MALSEDGIDAWVEQLADRDPASASVEARVLREVLLDRAARERQQQGSARGLDALEEHALQRLRFRLKQEGLLKRPLRRWTLWLPAAAVAMLLAAVGVKLYLPGSQGVEYAVAYEEPPRYRSTLVQIQLRTDKPLEAAQQLAVALDKLGAQPKFYVWQGSAILDFETTPETLTAVQRALADNKWPADALRVGLNRLVFNER